MRFGLGRQDGGGLLLVGLLVTRFCVAASNLVVPSNNELISLAHPELYNSTEISERLEQCHDLVDRLPIASVDPRVRSYRDLAHLFIWFAEETGKAPGQGDRLWLSLLEDPVLQRLQREVGLAIPSSCVFVRTYKHVDAMPPPIRRAFVDQPNTRAVTFLSHYVAVLDKEDDGTPLAVRMQRLQQTLAHEWVHVVVNSHLREYASQLPVWFHEGCATTYSGQAGSSSVGALTDTGRGVQMVTYSWHLPPSYAEYRRVFRYIEHRFGRASLNAWVLQAVRDRSVAGFLKNVQVCDEDELLRCANRWQRHRENWFWATASAVLVVAGYGIWRRLPRKSKPPPEVV